jgi:uroporphyrinogen-III synthase
LSSPSLGGRVIACLEARNAAELADLVTRHGGITYPAPCLREVHEPDAVETRLAVDLLCGESIHGAVFLTGVGVQTIVEGARRLDREAELLAGLATKRVAVRGPKTLNALRRLGVRVDLATPEPFTSDCLLEAITAQWDLHYQTVLVQRYGAPVPVLTRGLEQLGATVIEVSPYRWERPLDEDAVVRLIEDLAAGWIDVLAATNAAQVDHLFEIARDRGYEPALRHGLRLPRLRIAAQGVVCASAFERQGVDVHLIPPRTSMGALVMEIAKQFGDQPVVAQPASVGLDGQPGVVAVFVARGGPRALIRSVIHGFSTELIVAVLAGNTRSGERLAEQVAIERGLAVHRVMPARPPRHPADDLVRKASQVLIVASNENTSIGVGRLLQLAERYAKPVRVVRTPVSGGSCD